MNKAIEKTTQLKTIFHYLQNNVATATMVSEATRVPQKSVCRYKRDLELKGLLYEVEKKPCKVTGFSAWYLSANALLITKNNTDNGK
ncbi:hypothetical protein [Cellulophaga sp. L1A9]|uniref:hypothetical protein n=1 Tax=Cellulophaga sp. L1A9 TaxID=2686362 RepID=UPI0018EEF2C8|nr:hypothetical protein [Cellulophaga sp. L1A9]